MSLRLILLALINFVDVDGYGSTVAAEASGDSLYMNCYHGTIEVTSATYGANCGAPNDNQLIQLQNACNNQNSCRYYIDHRIIGDPARGCGKTYDYEYFCKYDEENWSELSEEASGKTLRIDCGGSNINILSATYGANCGTYYNNQLHNLKNACRSSICSYIVDHRIIGDPAHGCGKRYQYSWQCGDSAPCSDSAPAKIQDESINSDALKTTKKLKSSHNNWVYIMIAVGVVALVLIICIIGCIGKHFYKVKDKKVAFQTVDIEQMHELDEVDATIDGDESEETQIIKYNQ